MDGMVNEQIKDGSSESLASIPGGHPYDEAGIDRTLIRWMLSLTPPQRLEVLRQNVESLERMRRAAAKI
jgi:hypothetical protein